MSDRRNQPCLKKVDAWCNVVACYILLGTLLLKLPPKFVNIAPQQRVVEYEFESVQYSVETHSVYKRYVG